MVSDYFIGALCVAPDWPIISIFKEPPGEPPGEQPNSVSITPNKTYMPTDEYEISL